jgi:two-component system, OmpR family, response regulator
MRLLIVEDDDVIATVLKRGLQWGGAVVDVSPDGNSALGAASVGAYDCVVLDLGLPDIDGTVVLRELRRQALSVPVIVLSARDETTDRVACLDLGADDYLAKPFELSELEARIRAVTRRAIALSGQDVTIGQLRLSLSGRSVHIGDDLLEVSPREFAVLECLLLRHDRVVSKRQLVELICTRDEDLTENAIELYVHRVRHKIAMSGCTIRTLRGFGYLLQETVTEASTMEPHMPQVP